MDSHLFRKAAYRLPALAGLAVLRFNTRGTESDGRCSEGEFDGGDNERFDVAAALDFVDYHDLPSPWLVGWSFGTDLALRHGGDPRLRRDPDVTAAALLRPTPTSTTGRIRGSRSPPSSPSSTTTCARRRP